MERQSYVLNLCSFTLLKGWNCIRDCFSGIQNFTVLASRIGVKNKGK